MRIPGTEHTSKVKQEVRSFLTSRDSGAHRRIGPRAAKLPIGMLVALAAGACAAASESPVPVETARPSDVASSPTAPSGAFGTVPEATRGFPSVVTFEPDVAGTIAPQGRDDAVLLPPEVMDQIGGEFVPGVLLAQPAQPIEFRNCEDVLHNVHIADLESHATVANVATLPGTPYRMALDRAGAYLVVCDVHLAMEAYIIISASPYAVVANDDGSFELSEVPPGRYTMEVWNVDQAKRSRRTVDVAQTATDVTMRNGVHKTAGNHSDSTRRHVDDEQDPAFSGNREPTGRRL